MKSNNKNLYFSSIFEKIFSDFKKLYKWTFFISIFLAVFSIVEKSFSQEINMYRDNMLDFYRMSFQIPFLVAYTLLFAPFVRQLFNKILYSYKSLGLFENIETLTRQHVIIKRLSGSKVRQSFCITSMITGWILYKPWANDFGIIHQIYLYIAEGIYFYVLGLSTYYFIFMIKILKILNKKYKYRIIKKYENNKTYDIEDFNYENIFQPSSFKPVSQWAFGVAFYIIGLITITIILTPCSIIQDAYYILYAVGFFVQIFVFIYSMISTHEVMSLIKEKELSKVAYYLENIKNKLDARFVNDEYKVEQELSNTVTTLLAYEKRIESIKEWPYSTNIISKVLASILLPVLAGTILRIVDFFMI